MKFSRKLRSTLPSLFKAGGACIGFKKSWNQALGEFRSGTFPDPVIGPWIGTWNTDTNGNSGKLECLVSATEIPGTFAFRYHATWYRIFRGGYEVRYEVKPDSGDYVVEGSEDLGFFGKFHHRGRISGEIFTATYSNDREDIGGFQLMRPRMG